MSIIFVPEFPGLIRTRLRVMLDSETDKVILDERYAGGGHEYRILIASGAVKVCASIASRSTIGESHWVQIWSMDEKDQTTPCDMINFGMPLDSTVRFFAEDRKVLIAYMKAMGDS